VWHDSLFARLLRVGHADVSMQRMIDKHAACLRAAQDAAQPATSHRHYRCKCTTVLAVAQPLLQWCGHVLCVMLLLPPAGPVSAFPGHHASPGSADFIKGPTPPGGAAGAAEAPAGDATTPTAITVSVIKSPVGSETASDTGGESSAGSKSPRGPDLSAMLPTYDQLPAGEAGGDQQTMHNSECGQIWKPGRVKANCTPPMLDQEGAGGL
jgi:hypothetical protein